VAVRVYQALGHGPKPLVALDLRAAGVINLGEYLYTSPLQRYAQDFLQSVLDYAASLNEHDFLASMNSNLT
jgi:hypothetical protein